MEKSELIASVGLQFRPMRVLERHQPLVQVPSWDKPLQYLQRWLRRGSLTKAAVISSSLVVVTLVVLLRLAAWLLPSKIHLNLPASFASFVLLSLLALAFTFPVMWSVRIFYRDDIAELERRVAQRTAELQAANRELEAFSYSVSHDLRAPLRHIDAFSSILAGTLGPDVSPDVQRNLDRIRDSAKHMGNLIDDLLKMAQIGRQEVIRGTLDTTKLVQTLIRDLEIETRGRDVRWQVGDLPRLDCDPGLMKLVFVNLLSNAVKYSRRVEHAVIEVGHRRVQGASVIFVRDNGAGFDQKYAHKLFGVFQRLHRPEEFEGTGVGLATVQRIIGKHGGTIWAEGEVDRGATFSFTLDTAERL